MSVVKKVFDLFVVEPFNSLRHSDLISLAKVAMYRTYIRNEKILLAGNSVSHVYVVVSGSLQYGEDAVKDTFGVSQIFFSGLAKYELFITSDEATLLIISSKHLFTLVDECPEFLLGLLETEINL